MLIATMKDLNPKEYWYEELLGEKIYSIFGDCRSNYVYNVLAFRLIKVKVCKIILLIELHIFNTIIHWKGQLS